MGFHLSQNGGRGQSYRWKQWISMPAAESMITKLSRKEEQSRARPTGVCVGLGD